MTDDKKNKYTNPASAVITGLSDLFSQKKMSLLLTDDDRLDGKKALITGASSGLGFATAIQLAERGAHVIMACRSGVPLKGEEVKARSGSKKVDMIQVDFTRIESIKNLVNEVKSRFGTIDIFVCNAALVTKGSRQLPNGLDEMFMVNYFSKFLLVNWLLKEGCIVPGNEPMPRIVYVASESHRNDNEINWDTFGRYEPYKIGKTVEFYGYYKLLLVTFLNELSRRLNPDGETRCSVFGLCPGPVNSNIAREAPALFQPILKLTFKLFFRSPEKACEPVVYCAASKQQEGKVLDYLFLMNPKEMSVTATDPGNGRKLWKMTEDLIVSLGLTFPSSIH